MRPFLGIEPALLDYKEVSMCTLEGENVVCWDYNFAIAKYKIA